MTGIQIDWEDSFAVVKLLLDWTYPEFAIYDMEKGFPDEFFDKIVFSKRSARWKRRATRTR